MADWAKTTGQAAQRRTEVIHLALWRAMGDIEARIVTRRNYNIRLKWRAPKEAEWREANP